MDEAKLVDGLSAAQQAAVVSPANPLCIHAGAGSGKTRVLTRRIAYRASVGDVDPRRILALTFTRKAAGELIDRLAALGLRDQVVAGTFHGIAYAQLRSHWSDQEVRPPELLDRKGAIALDGGVMSAPGMYVLGLPFTRRRKSSFLDGVGPDAAPMLCVPFSRFPGKTAHKAGGERAPHPRRVTYRTSIGLRGRGCGSERWIPGRLRRPPAPW